MKCSKMKCTKCTERERNGLVDCVYSNCPPFERALSSRRYVSYSGHDRAIEHVSSATGEPKQNATNFHNIGTTTKTTTTMGA